MEFKQKNRKKLKLIKKISKIPMLNKIYYLFTYKKANPSIDFEKVDKILFVAHPDDETLFFSKELINKSGWLVVCITNGGNWIRQKEFISVMNIFKCQYKMLNYRDGFNVKWDEKKLMNSIEMILSKKNHWKLFATHNKEGEYGHFQHKELNRIIFKICDSDKVIVPVESEKLFNEEYLLPLEHYINKEKIIKNNYKSQSIMKCFERFAKYEGTDILR